jgi:hypothetical protein
MTAIERIQGALQGLGLKAVEARPEGLLEQAAKKEPSYADFLDELLGCEVEARRSRLPAGASAVGAPAVPQELRSVRVWFSALHR